MKKMEIRFQSLDDFQAKVSKTIKEGKKAIQPESLIYFESMADFRQFLTFQKIEVLAAIRHYKPQSMYELAKTLDRDFSAVLRDGVALESTGFINWDETGDSKNTKIPRLAFSYREIVIPERGCSINIDLFSHAA